MQGQIQQANPSKSGKTLSVQIGGQWYTSKHFELQNMVGQEITFTSSVQEFPDGGSCTWLNDYSASGAAPTPADQAMNQAMATQAPQRPVAAPSPRPNSRDKDATIGALALTKAVSGDAATVWGAFEFFYAKLLAWQQGDADFDDQIPF